VLTLRETNREDIQQKMTTGSLPGSSDTPVRDTVVQQIALPEETSLMTVR